MSLVCRRAEARDFPALEQMLELYQYELSDIWLQDTDALGRYGYDLSRHKQAERFFAYVACEGEQYVGFALVAPAAVTLAEGSWMEQFFVLKRFRRSGVGLRLAEHVIVSHPGNWEIGQMHANLPAQGFWRRVVQKLTDGKYVELQVKEGWWQGVVQQFRVQAAALKSSPSTD